MGLRGLIKLDWERCEGGVHLIVNKGGAVVNSLTEQSRSKATSSDLAGKCKKAKSTEYFFWGIRLQPLTTEHAHNVKEKAEIRRQASEFGKRDPLGASGRHSPSAAAQTGYYGLRCSSRLSGGGRCLRTSLRAGRPGRQQLSPAWESFANLTSGWFATPTGPVR